jgi:putative mRNA 3-end processing factor
MTDLLTLTDCGLYCSEGDFYIDPWRPVERALITHAHSDHARPGSRCYLCSAPGKEVLRQRVQPEARIDSLAYGERLTHRGVTVSFHPAGHVLGSAQIRVEKEGQVWVASGDYKVEPDATCAPFEPVACHTFITESTFGLPVYRWPSPRAVFQEINHWWRENVDKGRTSFVFAYPLGKSQRVLSGLDPSIGPILVHGAVDRFLPAYRQENIELPPTDHAGAEAAKRSQGRSMVVAPPSAFGSPWMRKFGKSATAFASGWMRIRGNRRRRGVDRGFVLSDHADWDGLIGAIRSTGAERVIATHGHSEPLVRWLNEQGWRAQSLRTEYHGEIEEDTGAGLSQESGAQEES